MKQSDFRIESNREIAPRVFSMTLSGDCAHIERAGQFVNIKLDGFFLRRPISVCSVDENILRIVYKVVGDGTRKMAEMREGETLNLLTGLGNGFSTEKSGTAPLLIGGGVGIPPMFELARRLAREGKRVGAILGFNTRDEIFMEGEFASVADKVVVTTADGSYGVKGFVTDAMGQFSYTYTYSCGPEPMLRAVHAKSETGGQYSFEERMGCGFGACMGCSCETLAGAKRICREGPVLEKEEILWQTRA